MTKFPVRGIIGDPQKTPRRGSALRRERKQRPSHPFNDIAMFPLHLSLSLSAYSLVIFARQSITVQV